MSASQRILLIFTRTPLHVGAGSSVGAIDMPIQRERHTQIPIIPGSSLKGVLRDLWEKKSAEQYELFGPESDENAHFAGNLLVGEARVVCFPVRSAKGSFAWLTSPLALQRYARDAGQNVPALDDLKDDQCLASSDVIVKNNQVVLEEYCFTSKGEPKAALDLLKGALPGEPVWATLDKRLVVVSDGIFSHFCATACEVQQRIRINDGTGTVDQGGLFNQENVPSETLFYAVVAQRDPKKKGLNDLKTKLDAVKVLQIGADETLGLGYCTVCLSGGDA